MKYLESMINAGFGVKVYGKWKGAMVVVTCRCHEDRYFVARTVKAALKAAWKDVSAGDS